VEAAYRAFDRVDSLMSTWRDDSVLSALNGADAGAWVEVGSELGKVLAEAKTVADFSGGAFDPTVLPLVRLWGFRGGDPALPDSLALAATRTLVNHRLLELDASKTQARLLAPGMEVDLGGIAKGYALDRAAVAMRAAGAKGGLIDLGGNILVFGAGPGHRVGIVDPDHEDLLLAAVPLVEAAAATSGQYERFLTIEGRKYGHILDPRTGWPAEGGISVTVISDRAILADALATAAVVLGMEKGRELLEKTPGVEGILAARQGDGFQLVTTTGYAPVSGSR
jgi:thiamine biosynthesis lipoprotein